MTNDNASAPLTDLEKLYSKNSRLSGVPLLTLIK